MSWTERIALWFASMLLSSGGPVSHDPREMLVLAAMPGDAHDRIVRVLAREAQPMPGAQATTVELHAVARDYLARVKLAQIGGPTTTVAFAQEEIVKLCELLMDIGDRIEDLSKLSVEQRAMIDRYRERLFHSDIKESA